MMADSAASKILFGDSPGTVDTSDMVILTCGSWLTGYARLPGQADLPGRRAPGGAGLGLSAFPAQGAAVVSGVRAGPQGRRAQRDAQQP